MTREEKELLLKGLRWTDMETLECHCYDCELFDYENNACKCIDLCKNPKRTYQGFYTKDTKEYQQNIKTNNPRVDTWDFSFISGSTLEEKATQLSRKYFPDEENIWARANIEALKCKSACMEMAEWLKEQKGE